MTISYKDSLRNTRMSDLLTAIGSSAKIKIYDATGGVPATVNTAIGSQVLLVDLPCSATFGVVSGADLTANAITPTLPTAGGTAAFYRICTSGGTAIVQGTCGVGSGDLQMGSLTITMGVTVEIASMVITHA